MRAQPGISSPNPTPTVTDSFTVVCTSTPSRPRPQFVWRHNGNLLTGSTRIMISTTDLQAESYIFESISTLTINAVALSDAGEFMCEIIQEDENLGQQLRSFAVSLQVTIRSMPI